MKWLVVVPQLFSEVFKAFSLDRVQHVARDSRTHVGRRRILGRSSGPSVPARSSSKEAANKAKRVPLRALRCVGCIQTPLGKTSCSSSMLANRMPETWFWCGTNLGYGVLAVPLAQTSESRADFVGSDMACDGLLLPASRQEWSWRVRSSFWSWRVTWSELGFFWLLGGERAACECRLLLVYPLTKLQAEQLVGVLCNPSGHCSTCVRRGLQDCPDSCAIAFRRTICSI